ncbi:MAG TPA: chemotaxis protein CheW [Bacteroidales bacterium]|nr:chemotaxis protein CheW [Bacteroidales bacterium]
MDDENSRILQLRAQKLSQPVSREELPEGNHIMLIFKLLPELFAVRAPVLLEVLQLPEIAHMPGLPACVAGVFHRRGKILPAINLKILFNFPKPGLTTLDKLVLVQTPQLTFGLLADEIVGLQHYDPTALRQPPGEHHTGCISGIFDQKVSLLEVEALAGQLFSPKTAMP